MHRNVWQPQRMEWHIEKIVRLLPEITKRPMSFCTRWPWSWFCTRVGSGAAPWTRRPLTEVVSVPPTPVHFFLLTILRMHTGCLRWLDEMIINNNNYWLRHFLMECRENLIVSHCDKCQGWPYSCSPFLYLLFENVIDSRSKLRKWTSYKYHDNVYNIL